MWRKTEKYGKPRVVPLLFDAPTLEQYRDMARVLPKANEWTHYEQIEDLFDELSVPIYSRKGNLPRLLLCGLMDRAESSSEHRLAPLMAQLRRGRADLFNLVLGHISRSYLLWTYMGMLIKDGDGKASKGESGAATAALSEHSKENKGVMIESSKAKKEMSTAALETIAEKDRVIAEQESEIAELRAQLKRLRTQQENGTMESGDSSDSASEASASADEFSPTITSSPFSLSPLSSPLRQPLSPL